MIKEKLRTSGKNRDRQVARLLGGLLEPLLDRTRIRERIQKANRWAACHPRMTCCLTVGLLSLSLLVNLWLALGCSREGGHSAEADGLGLGTIADVQPMFSGFRRIQRGKTLQTSRFNAMVADGRRIKSELDSLVALPAKDHGDSTAIVVKYRQLEYIVQTLKTPR